MLQIDKNSPYSFYLVCTNFAGIAWGYELSVGSRHPIMKLDV
jgi:hypothetical protein